MRLLVVAITLCFGAGLGRATPFAYETGLPAFPAPGHDVTLGEPVTADGVESPYGQWRKLAFGLQGDAFVSFRLASRQDGLFNEFELSRLQLSAWTAWDTWAGVNLTIESLRSSGSRSYFGVDGDSLLPRLKYAFAEATPLRHWLALRAGIVPDLLLPWVESAWTFRAQGPTGIERDGMFVPGDLGISLEAALPAAYGSIAISYGNGEGTHLREQNNGKNTTVVAHLRPAGRRLPALVVHLLYRDGSIGAGSAADRRVAGGLTYAGRRLGGGAIATWAMGWQGLGARDAAHLTVFARGELPRRFFLFARSDLLWPDVNERSGLQVRLIGGIAYALPSLIRILLSYEGTLPFGSLTTAVPALREHDFLAQIEARL